SRRDFHRDKGTITGSDGGIDSADASRSSVQRSSTTARSLMSCCGIDAFLEGVDADSMDRVDKTLVFVPIVDVRIDQARDDVGHLVRGEGWTDHLAERRIVSLRAADRHLVPLGAILVDAEDADISDVMMAAGVHAARDV